MSRSLSNLRTIRFSMTSAIATSMLVAGCTVPYGPQFRDTALPAIQTGVHSILDGFVDGVFASIEPENDGDSESNP